MPATSKKRKAKGKGQKVDFDLIKRALENPKYKYRTLKGVSAEANISIDAVEKALQEHSDEIVFLFRKGKNGEALLTTRNYYKKKASLKEKFMGAVINRVY
ncbi:hypothetical protein [Ectopseudomonas hydrolytica]|uniref:hypothetical protein n=1 Tax=Ectopseudomonas hydrolytica TaxID=2493633 RepID=UPI0020B884C2|nr:hypothetical protein [Pseudomonas hydrolytica]UTH30090.1 hypothetical protein NLY38_16795 [Pseudomonas hydrolytica]UZZ09101.1 hypothetical protein NDO41_17050 [Pseudomonas mendocina]